MEIKIQVPSLVMLVGVSLSGKSTFAAKHFKPTEVLASDTYRQLVNDELTMDKNVSDAAYAVLHAAITARLKLGKLVVVDASNCSPKSREELKRLALEQNVPAYAIMFDAPESVLHERANAIGERTKDIRKHLRDFKQANPKKEGFITTTLDQTTINLVQVEKVKPESDARQENGPFDIIGDVHGCLIELKELLVKLGYDEYLTHPQNRRLIFVGDLNDRGPNSIDVVRFVQNAVEKNKAFCVRGNHDDKLGRALSGAKVKVSHGLEATLKQFETISEEEKAKLSKFINTLPIHLIMDGGKLVVAHAGLPENLHGRTSDSVKRYALFGNPTGDVDENGHPIRNYSWAESYTGEALIVHGHFPVHEVRTTGKVVNIDTGCCFGGKLTAFRYPEKEIVQIPAKAIYAPGGISEPLPKEQLPVQEDLDINQLLDNRVVQTRFGTQIKFRESQAVEALEQLSRYTIVPEWLVYMPPTISPCESSKLPNWLEHPNEAFEYYKKNGIESVICEEKHMGSRAVIVVCKDLETAKKRFADNGEATQYGVIYTRTGRAFFDDAKTEASLIDIIRRSLQDSGLFDELGSWIVLDAELMPWNAKAMGLIREQYAALSSAALLSLPLELKALGNATNQDQIKPLLEKISSRDTGVRAFQKAYRNYCWEVKELGDYKIAPFHILASEKLVMVDKPHTYHMELAKRMKDADTSGVIKTTGYKVVNLADAESVATATLWWESLTANGGEGMVVKTLDFIPKTHVLPSMKVRGKEYLRIIYGPDYDAPDVLPRLKQRSLRMKQRMAIDEFTVGVEGLYRLQEGQSLKRVHECAFAVLALESEGVDPRL